MDREYIGLVIISPEMEQKLNALHHVSGEEVREACQVPNRYHRAWWDYDEERGWRLLVVGETHAGRRLKIVLREVDRTDGTWRLRTAYQSTR